MEVYEIIQYCEILQGSGDYNKERFIQAVTEMPAEQFNRFCREYLHLLEFYHFHLNFWIAEDLDFIKNHPGFLIKVDPIDFDTPVSFVRRK